MKLARTTAFAAVLVSISALTGAAPVHAASLPDLAIAPAPTPAPQLPLWTSIYFGGHAGHGWLDGDIELNDGKLASVQDSGGLIGGQLGINVQFGNFVVGIEGDISRPSISESSTFALSGATVGIESDISKLMSARVRLGVTTSDYLVYLTGGYARMEIESTVDMVAGGSHTVATAKDKIDGFVFGGGVEWRALEKISLRTEILHYEFDRHQTVGADRLDVDLGTTVVRTALNLHF